MSLGPLAGRGSGGARDEAPNGLDATRRLLSGSEFVKPGDAQFSCRASPYMRLIALRRDAVIRVYGDSGNVIETHEHAGDFKES